MYQNGQTHFKNFAANALRKNNLLFQAFQVVTLTSIFFQVFHLGTCQTSTIEFFTKIVDG